MTHLIRVSGGRHCLILESAVLLLSAMSHFVSIHLCCWLHAVMVQTAILLQCGVIVAEIVVVSVTCSTHGTERWWLIMVERAVVLLVIGGTIIFVRQSLVIEIAVVAVGGVAVCADGLIMAQLAVLCIHPSSNNIFQVKIVIVYSSCITCWVGDTCCSVTKEMIYSIRNFNCLFNFSFPNSINNNDIQCELCYNMLLRLPCLIWFSIYHWL